MAKKETKNSKNNVTKKDNKPANKNTKVKQKVKKESYFKKMKKEIALVKWPTAKEVLKYSITTISLCIFIVLFFVVLNLLLSFIKGMFV